tara:strand:+ start:594 stop:1145 length:552 start_codon:yes stop_codon:yes gene_type:complete
MNILTKNVPNIIYGSIDGIITTLAIIVGVIGAKQNMMVAFILAIANLLADGFSMAVSSYESVLVNQYPHHNLYRGLFTFASFILIGGIPLLFFSWALTSKSKTKLFTAQYIRIILGLTFLAVMIVAILKAHFQEKMKPGHEKRNKSEKLKIKIIIILQTLLTCLIAGLISYGVAHNLTNYFEK